VVSQKLKEIGKCRRFRKDGEHLEYFISGHLAFTFKLALTMEYEESFQSLHTAENSQKRY
jgi:hypothetical protein